MHSKKTASIHENPFINKISLSDVKKISAADANRYRNVNEWTCCCLSGKERTDSRLIKFCAIYVVLMLVIVFAMAMLLTRPSCEEQTSYMSLLTLLIGLVIPHP